jgi:hypothetical protein
MRSEVVRAVKAANATASRALKLGAKGDVRGAVRVAQRDAAAAVGVAESLLNYLKRRLVGR